MGLDTRGGRAWEGSYPGGGHQDEGAAFEGERLALRQLPAQAAPHRADRPDAPAFAWDGVIKYLMTGSMISQAFYSAIVS